MGKYEAYMAPSQEQVDKFIADNDANGVFKIISMGEQVFVFTTATGSVTVNYFERKVSSAFPMVILTPSGELIDTVLEVEWLENVGVIQEHELYLHSPDMGAYSKYLASVPVPPDRTYDNLFIFQRDNGTIYAYYTNGDIIKEYTDNPWTLATKNYGYRYDWVESEQKWIYGNSVSGAWELGSEISTVFFTSSTLYQYDTNTVFREADDLSLITWKHLTEIPEFPTEWQGKNWSITKHESGDLFRLYIVNGTLHEPNSDGYYGSGDSGWNSYKWDGVSWIFRSTATSYLNASGVEVFYTPVDITNYNTGELVYPAGYTNIAPILNT